MRSNTMTFGLSLPAKCTVIVKIFRSSESPISSVAITLEPTTCWQSGRNLSQSFFDFRNARAFPRSLIEGQILADAD